MSSESSREVRNDQGISPVQAYLLIYNLGCAMGWNLVMFETGNAFLDNGGVKEATEATHDKIVVLQLISTLEILHSFIGLVKSNPVNVIMQVLGRNLALFCVVTPFPAVHESIWVFMMFSAWATSEVIRYPFYALSMIGKCPPALHWLRYTAFVILYPIGFAGEFGTWIVGLPHVKALDMLTVPGLPKDWMLYVIFCYMALAFGYGAPRLYWHMLRQRRKQLDPMGLKAKAS